MKFLLEKDFLLLLFFPYFKLSFTRINIRFKKLNHSIRNRQDNCTEIAALPLAFDSPLLFVSCNQQFFGHVCLRAISYRCYLSNCCNNRKEQSISRVFISKLFNALGYIDQPYVTFSLMQTSCANQLLQSVKIVKCTILTVLKS